MSSIVVRDMTTPTDMLDASAVLAAVWGTELAAAPLQHDVLSGIHHAGGSVLGAWDSQTLVGVAVAIAGAPCSNELHGMITGVAHTHRGTGVGTALKLAQRDWGLRRGAIAMRWTFDPMLLANATLNLNRLGGIGIEFVPDFYAPIDDDFNAGTTMDRLVVRWSFDPPGATTQASPLPARAAIVRDSSGLPSLADAADWAEDRTHATTVAIPHDIVDLRRRDPEGARQWTDAYRTVLPVLCNRGFRAVSVTSGSYRFEPTTAEGVGDV